MFDDQGFFNIFSVLNELKIQKYLFISITLICTLGAYVYSKITTPEYEAQITLMPISQQGEEATGGLGAVSSLIGQSNTSVDIPTWLEATIIMETRDFSSKFITSQNIMQILIDENDLDILWDDLSREEKKIILNDLALLWSTKYIEIEKEDPTNIITFSVISENKELATKWATQYINDINAYMKEFLKAEAEYKIQFYRERIQEEKINDIRTSLINLLASAIQERALINTKDEVVLRTIDHAGIALLKFPILKLNIAIGLFVGLMLGLLTVFFIAAFKRHKDVNNKT